METKLLNNLFINIFDSRLSMGQYAAAAVAERIHNLLTSKAEVSIIFAAAPSQNEFLAELVEKEIPWEKINAFHMDEYIGLNPQAPQGFGNFLKSRIFDRRPFKSVHYLNGNAPDISQECLRYARLLNEQPIDIVCMGIGENGHLAFNDPPVANFNDPQLVKEVELDMMCRQQQVNDGCFEKIEDVPTHALTLTIPALLQADCLSVVVPGASKAEAIFNTVTQAVSERFPSTILRKHPNVKLFLDQDSSKEIR